MDFLSIVALGLTQGITEWIPVSSKTQDTFVYLTLLNGSGSLVVPILLYLHLGTLLAAIIYFSGEIKAILLAIAKRPASLRAYSEGKPAFIITSLIFTGIVGVPLLLLEKKVLPSLTGPLLFAVMAAGLLLTGFLLLKQRGRMERKESDANWLDGVLTGILQGFSVLPGVSRAGTSTTGLIWRGFDAESSFRLSFLLSIPTVMLAEMVFYVGGLMSFPLYDGLLLAASSFVFGYLTLDSLLRVVKKVNMAYVAFALGILMLAAALLGAG